MRTKLMVAFMAIAALSFGLLSLVYLNSLRNALQDRAHQALYAAASRTAVSLDVFIESNLNAVRTEAQLPDIRTYMSLPPDQRAGSIAERQAAVTIEALRLKEFLYISSYALIDQDGTNLLDTFTPNVGQNEARDECVQKPLRDGRPSLSPVTFAQNVGDVYFCFSSPIHNNQGQISGVLRLRYSIAILQDIVFESRGLVGQNSYAILLDENYLRLTHETNPELIFKTVTPPEAETYTRLRANGRLPNLPLENVATNLPTFRRGLENAHTQPFFTAETGDNNNDLEEIAVVTLQMAPWTIVYLQPQSTFLAPIQQAIRAILLNALFLGILVIFAALLITQWLSYPITHLTRVAEQIASGNLDAQAPVLANDEIGQLATTFNNMTSRLRATLDGLRQRNEQLSQEIQERQRAEEALQIAKDAAEAANEAKSRFLANMSHELRTPLHAILGYIQVIASNKSLDLQHKHGLNVIKRSAEHLLILINEVLNLSKIEAGEMTLLYKPFDLRQLLENIINLIEVQARQKNLRLLFTPYNFAQDKPFTRLPQIVMGDEVRLQQILINLLDNAIKFTQTGSVTLKVGPSPNGQNEMLRFWVEDTGIGIPPKYLGEIFSPFQQVEEAYHPEGTGLGLSISHHLVQMMGGELRVQSQPGLGSVFWFDILLPVSRESTLIETTLQDVVDITPGILITVKLPPHEWLESLYDAAQIGDVDAVWKKLRALESESNGRFQPFITHIQKLAEQFQVDKICVVLQQYLEKNHEQ